MDTKTCPHCGYIWTPRKENPKKCPQCANPLWQSQRPKKKKNEPVAVVAQLAEQPVFSGPVEGSIPSDSPTIEDRLASARAKVEALFNKLK